MELTDFGEEYKLCITAVRGEQNEGYVALDDFKFDLGEEFCTVKPAGSEPTEPPPSTTRFGAFTFTITAM